MTLPQYEPGDVVYDAKNVGGIVLEIKRIEKDIQFLLVEITHSPEDANQIGRKIEVSSVFVKKAYALPALDEPPQDITQYAVQERTFVGGPWDRIIRTDIRLGPGRGKNWTLEAATEYVNTPYLRGIPTPSWRRVVSRKVTEWEPVDD